VQRSVLTISRRSHFADRPRPRKPGGQPPVRVWGTPMTVNLDFRGTSWGHRRLDDGTLSMVCNHPHRLSKFAGSTGETYETAVEGATLWFGRIFHDRRARIPAPGEAGVSSILPRTDPRAAAGLGRYAGSVLNTGHGRSEIRTRRKNEARAASAKPRLDPILRERAEGSHRARRTSLKGRPHRHATTREVGRRPVGADLHESWPGGYSIGDVTAWLRLRSGKHAPITPIALHRRRHRERSPALSSMFDLAGGLDGADIAPGGSSWPVVLAHGG